MGPARWLQLLEVTPGALSTRCDARALDLAVAQEWVRVWRGDFGDTAPGHDEVAERLGICAKSVQRRVTRWLGLGLLRVKEPGSTAWSRPMWQNSQLGDGNRRAVYELTHPTRPTPASGPAAAGSEPEELSTPNGTTFCFPEHPPTPHHGNRPSGGQHPPDHSRRSTARHGRRCHNAGELRRLLPQLAEVRASAIQARTGWLWNAGYTPQQVADRVLVAGVRWGTPPNTPTTSESEAGWWVLTDPVRSPLGWLDHRIHSDAFHFLTDAQVTHRLPIAAAAGASFTPPAHAPTDAWTVAATYHAQLQAAHARGETECDHGEPRGPSACPLCRRAHDHEPLTD